MKGFKPFGKSFSFPTSADSSSRGSITQQLVRPHFRTKAVRTPEVPTFAKGGPVSKPNLPGDSGNSAVKRSSPTTTLDAQHGGKGPLTPGYAKGGSTCEAAAKKAVAKHVATPAPKGHKGLKK